VNGKVVIIVVVAAVFVLTPLLYVSGGCLFYVRVVGTFYPDSESKIRKGEFEPYVTFSERFRRGGSGFSLPVVCTPSAYRHDSVMLDTADVTKTMGYERFDVVQIDLFEMEYQSGDKQVLIGADSSPREYRVCNGAYADCGMDSRDFPDKHELDKQEDLIVKVRGVAKTMSGEKEEFIYQQEWKYKERLSIKSFLGAMP
jgi:hypothetical protein